MRARRFDETGMIESESFYSNKEKSLRNSKLGKIYQLNKASIVNKKILNRIILYTEMDLKEDELYTKYLKTCLLEKRRKSLRQKWKRL